MGRDGPVRQRERAWEEGGGGHEDDDPSQIGIVMPLRLRDSVHPDSGKEAVAWRRGRHFDHTP